MFAFPLKCPCNTNKGDLHCSWNDRLSRRYDNCNAWPLDWLWGQWHCYSECGDCSKSSNQATKEVGSKKGQLSVPKIGETRAVFNSYSQNQARGKRRAGCATTWNLACLQKSAALSGKACASKRRGSLPLSPSVDPWVLKNVPFDFNSSTASPQQRRRS